MIIGLCGYAQAGKDTSCKLMGFRRMAFADALKRDVAQFCAVNYGIDVWDATDDEKKIIRPILVAHGEVMRNIKPDHWLDILLPKSFVTNEDVAITDVRYLNEAKRICALGGYIFHIIRDSKGPANRTEGASIQEIIGNKGHLKHLYISNNGTRDQLKEQLENGLEYVRAEMAGRL